MKTQEMKIYADVNSDKLHYLDTTYSYGFEKKKKEMGNYDEKKNTSGKAIRNSQRM